MGAATFYSRVGAYLLSRLGQMKKIRKLAAAGQTEEKDRQIYALVSDLCQKAYRWSGVEMQVTGLENIPAETAVFVANHQSVFDALVMLDIVKDHGPFGFVMKKEFEKIPLLKSCCSLINCVFIDREHPRAAVKALKAASDHLKNGISMVIFPEGTRTKNYPVMADFKNGAFKIAQENKNPIVPVVIFDAGIRNEAAGKMSGGTIHVKVLPPVITETMSRAEYKNIADILNEQFKQELKAFHGDSYQD